MSRSKTHFQRPKKPRGRSLLRGLRGFGVGIFATRLLRRPERNRAVMSQAFGVKRHPQGERKAKSNRTPKNLVNCARTK